MEKAWRAFDDGLAIRSQLRKLWRMVQEFNLAAGPFR